MSDQDNSTQAAGVAVAGIVTFVIILTLAIASWFAFNSPSEAKKETATVASANLSSNGKFDLSVANGAITLEGAVADEGTKSSLLKRAALLFGLDKVVDKITVDAAAPDLGWKSHALDLMASLKRWGQGALSFDVGSLKISGAFPEAVKATLSDWAARFFGPGVKLDVSGVTVDANAVAGANSEALLSESIEFASGSADLGEQNRERLNMIADVLKDLGRSVVVSGHTDSTGDAAANLALSEQRAQAVRIYLINQGVNEALLIAKGYGQTQPYGDNATEEGRKLNRRIEFHAY